MKLPKLFKISILKKYKMFFVDGTLPSGEVVTAYTKNKGGFKKEMAPGKEVYVSFHDDPNRKTKYSVELIHHNGKLSGVDPNIAHKLLDEYLLNHKEIKVLQKETSIKDSRLDLKLSINGIEGYGEIKSVLSYEHNTARFPEAPTPRGQKHLKLLIELAKKKIPVYLFYIVQVPHAEKLLICKDIDPEYGKLMISAQKAGVKIIALKCDISLKDISISTEIPIEV